MKTSLFFPIARRVAWLLVGIVPLLLLPACNRSNPVGASAQPRVALIMKSLANEFSLAMADGAKKHHAAHAADYDLIVNGIKNETDLAEQMGLVEQILKGEAPPADQMTVVDVVTK